MPDEPARSSPIGGAAETPPERATAEASSRGTIEQQSSNNRGTVEFRTRVFGLIGATGWPEGRHHDARKPKESSRRSCCRSRCLRCVARMAISTTSPFCSTGRPRPPAFQNTRLRLSFSPRNSAIRIRAAPPSCLREEMLDLGRPPAPKPTCAASSCQVPVKGVKRHAWEKSVLCLLPEIRIWYENIFQRAAVVAFAVGAARRGASPIHLHDQ